jgi:drug/metabolite transporter (DMT)-like permease
MVDSSSVSDRIPLRNEVVALLQIFASSLLFGISFVYQRYAMLRGIGPITFNACRFPISTILTIAVQFLMLPKSSSSPVSDVVSRYTIRTFKWGILCGFFIFGGSVLQQIGLLEVQAAKMSFITGSYVIFVPIVEWCLPGFGMHLNYSVWISAVVSIIGMYFLSGCVGYENCFNSDENIFQSGEMIIFGSMLFWVIVIMATDVAVKEVDCLSLAVVENFVCSVLTIAAAMAFEPNMVKYPYNVIAESWDLIVIVASVEGSAVVFGILGQVYINPSITALISSSASVYTAIGGYFFLGEVLRPVELLGCALILSATVAASYQIKTEELKTSYISIPV